MVSESMARSSSFYRIAVSMEVADLMQLLANSIASVSLTYLENTNDYYWLNNICSGMLGCGWMACAFQAHLLSFNR
uniref:Uncharacterized protein n=1 Tax=Romanomermis culicivorax TaxID=13658 RepID=A0A915L685_ROMCU